MNDFVNGARRSLSRRSILGGSAAVALAAPALVGRVAAAAEVTWRLQSHFPKASSSFNDSVQTVVDGVAERTDGRLRIEAFGDGEFAKGAEIYNIVRRGVVQMASCSLSYIPDETEVASFAYGIPGTLRESWEVEHYLKNLGIEELVNQDLNPEGVLYRSEKVYPTELVVSKEVSTIEDFQGLKLRSSGPMMDYLAAAGAAPQYLAGAELYQALSSGVVDGAHWGAAIGANSMSLWEVAKYHFKPPLGINGEGFMINVEAFEALPEDLKQPLLSVVEERFFLRSVEYQHKEAIALSEGIANQQVILSQFPDAVLEKMTAASRVIFEREAERGEKAAKAADTLQAFMKDLGYL